MTQEHTLYWHYKMSTQKKKEKIKRGISVISYQTLFWVPKLKIF